jgi:hypothetical protein
MTPNLESREDWVYETETVPVLADQTLRVMGNRRPCFSYWRLSRGVERARTSQWASYGLEEYLRCQYRGEQIEVPDSLRIGPALI